ncbi:MAG: RNA polymerase sigma factor [Verrucomicrobiales bacterium]
MTERQSHFPETRWTLIDAIRDGRPSAFEALSEVCEIYWYPVYAFFRDQGKPHHDAQDLTQGFFEGLLRRDDLSGIEQEAGNFRAFLSAAARNFAISEYWRGRAEKRGGGKSPVSFDEGLADRLYRKEQLVGGDDPELIYDKRWAKALLDGVLTSVRREAEAKGKAKEFTVLESYLEPNGREQPIKRAAKALSMTEGAVRVVVFRLRRRYGELLRLEMAKLVQGSQAIEEEIRYLLLLMGRNSDSAETPWLLSD